MTLYPVQIGAETVRCRTGVPTLHLETLIGNVQITPGAFDHGHITVGVGVYNKGYHAINFGVENISATINGLPIAVVGSAELQKACQEPRDVVANRTGRSCRAAASQAYTTSRFSGVLRTPHGTYVWASYDRDNSIGGLGITAAIDGGTSGIIGI